jgi:hypothetical protein
MQALAVDKAARKIMLSSDPKLPKGKRYTKVEKAAENYRLVRKLIEPLDLIGKVLTVRDVASLTRAAAEVLQCPSDLVRPLTQEFLDVLVDASTLDLFAWQVAGNRTPVKEKEINLFNNRQSEKGWMAGIILDVVRSTDNTNQYAKIKLLDGPGAGFVVYAKLPESKFYRISYILGNMKKGSDKKNKGMQDLRQCVLNHVLVYLNGEGNAYRVVQGATYKRIVKSTNVQTIGWLRATAKQKKLNKELFLTRLKPCVKRLKVTCHFCRHGYDGVDSCFRGCRPKTLAESSDTPIVITLKGKNICQRNLEEV